MDGGNGAKARGQCIVGGGVYAAEKATIDARSSEHGAGNSQSADKAPFRYGSVKVCFGGFSSAKNGRFVRQGEQYPPLAANVISKFWAGRALERLS